MSLPHLNPLNIPEIIALVGRYTKERQEVDLWGPSKTHTKELFSLTLVSKTWHAALIPVLWESYNGNKMIRVPNDVITKYSPHFRTIINFKHSGPLTCTKVKKIEIGYNNIPEAWLLQQPLPRLTAVSWQGSSRMWGSTMELDLSEPSDDKENEIPGNDPDTPTIRLSMLPTNLSSLELHQCSISNMPSFLQLLTRFSKLSRLSLAVSADWESLISIDEEYLTPTPLLIAVKHLHLDFTKHSGNGALSIISHCPHLEKLKIVGSWVSLKRFYRRTPFYKFSPSLRDLDIDSIGFYDQHNVYNGPDGDDLATLIHDLTGAKMPETGKLRSIRVKLAGFNSNSSDAISMHGENLESLELELANIQKISGGKNNGLNNLEEDQENLIFEGIRNILTKSSRLKYLSIRHDYYRAQGCGDQAKLLFRDPWPCSNKLQELDISLPPSRDSKERVMDDIQADYEDDHGGPCIWRAESKIRLENSLENLIFENVRQMPQLWRLKLNKVRIFKIKSYEKKPEFIS
ncbi:hypothetical protein BGZ80_007564 [Entomortierella chlamydospora]|uniref:F-box domain-containing protein n=1 Tax=Entomortierella chlamydospora TaxID=101097 RepID=A0A9P6T4X1_9FUNG|nr:hypothetical protein BGZ79_006556 [Entomortierella chlamydospora]KAG0023872.1 hypothetical protein BGZ80_007564 [Entomortierella chlamydospora]